jgi:hypothetical protein
LGSEKKSGGGLDDLKARLGLDSVLSKAKREPPKPAVSPPAPSAGGDGPPPPPGSASVAGPGRDAEVGPLAAPPPDYSTDVSHVEEPVAGEGQSDPVLSGSHHLVDLNLAVPVSRGARLALIGVVVVAVLIALGAGYGFGKVMRDREVAAEVQVTYGRLGDQVEGVAQRLRDLQAALSGFESNEYRPELQAVLSRAFQGTGPTLSARALSDARIIMTTGEDLTRYLIEYAMSTQILKAMVQEHTAKTTRDQRLIESMIAAQGERQANYGVVFSWDAAERTFREFWDARQQARQNGEDPESIVFMPARGAVVTYESPLQMTVQNPDADVPNYQYQVLVGGRRENVAVYNLLLVDADQFVANPNEETALTRYAGRVAQIRNYLESLLATQEMLLQRLRARGGDVPPAAES